MENRDDDRFKVRGKDLNLGGLSCLNPFIHRLESLCYLQIVYLVIASMAKQSRKPGSPRRFQRLAMTIK